MESSDLPPGCWRVRREDLCVSWGCRPAGEFRLRAACHWFEFELNAREYLLVNTLDTKPSTSCMP